METYKVQETTLDWSPRLGMQENISCEQVLQNDNSTQDKLKRRAM